MTVTFSDSADLNNVSETIDFTFTEGLGELVIGVVYEPSGIGELAYINGEWTALFNRSTFDGSTCHLRRRNRWPGKFRVEVREGTLAITYVPSNYTAAVPTSADSHLEGIDDEFLLVEQAITQLEADVADAQADATAAGSAASAAQTTANTKAASWSWGSNITGNTTALAADHRKIRKNTGSNVTYTLSSVTGHAAGDHILLIHQGTGTFTVGGSGVTINKPAGCAATAFDVGSVIMVVFESSTQAHIFGRLTPT